MWVPIMLSVSTTETHNSITKKQNCAKYYPNTASLLYSFRWGCHICAINESKTLIITVHLCISH